MICLGKSCVFLRGYDQASSIPAADLQAGEKLTIQHDKRHLYDAFAVAVENLRGQFLGRVARELSKGCYKFLRQIQSTNFQLTATFSQLVTEVGKYDNYSNSTAVHIDQHYSVCRGDDDGGHVRQKQEEVRKLVEQCKLPFASSNLAEREIEQDWSEFATEQVTTKSSKGGKNTSAEKKRSCFTFEGRALK